MKLKLSNPATKMSDLQPGHIQKRRVRCGKLNCRCAHGEMHSAFYHVWHLDGQRYQRYVRRSQIDSLRDACEAHRTLQIQLRAGRAKYKFNLARARELFRMLSL
jgi:hypothetical protein